MRRRLLFFAFAMCSMATFAQRQGFFNVYEREDKSFSVGAAIETDDGCMIVSLYDYNGGSGELVKLSSEGNMLKRIPISDESVFSALERLYRDPQSPDLFCGIGHVTHWEEQVAKPMIVRFDEGLNLIDSKEVDLPDVYPRFRMTKAILTKDGDFIYAASLNPPSDWRRIYMRIALDGTLLSFNEVAADNNVWINEIFEFPDGNRFGEYRNSHEETGLNRQRLFGFTDSFVFDTICEFPSISQTEGDTVYSLGFHSMTNATVFPFNDSTLLFSANCNESWWHYYSGTTYGSDKSVILFSSDLEGNIKNYLIVGSNNDTLEEPTAFRSVDVAKGILNSDKQIYHACYGRNDWFTYSPYNITLTKTKENLDVIWQESFTHPSRHLMATYLMATNDGGCVVMGGANNWNTGHYDFFVIKVNSDGMLCSDENMVEVPRPYIFYPNPVKDQLRMEFSPDVQPVQIELYDLQGRLVGTQRNGLGNVDMSRLPFGTYMMRVTLEDGKTFVDKVVKE
jgi:hypothetical protein